MNNLQGMNIAVCQMRVVPGRPDLNTKYIIQEIDAAAARGVDIIVFPEMAVPGYFIGDLPEDDYFVRDVMRCNNAIIQATSSGIVAVWGSIFSIPGQNGEDGRLMKWNAGLVAQHGKLVKTQRLPVAIKTLQPNYRIFADERHFFSLRKLAELQSVKHGYSANVDDYLFPFPVQISKPNGTTEEVNLGVMLCEDQWHKDYPLNPGRTLAQNGATVIISLNSSNFTWQKNRKRHSVIKELLRDCQGPLVYVNNAGAQDNGKNWIPFDGSSTVYNAAGGIVHTVAPYYQGSSDYVFDSDAPVIQPNGSNDTAELFQALKAAINGAFAVLPPSGRKVVVGLSGGIDSAVTCALFAHVLGQENVVAVNMPSQYNSQTTKDIAQAIAVNLGIEYLVKPIGGIVEAIASQTGTDPDSLSYENIQARARMEIIAAVAQDRSAVYSANGNKVELAFGYGTLYGDIAGFIAPLADLVKREVYQLAAYLNREVHQKEVIPQTCFDIAPTAELKNSQRDPFDYGSLQKRGYHDEMVRAFTEFRRNPEWFLEQYAKGSLEESFQLDPGTLKRLFPTARDFVRDLEEKWNMLHRSYFKRVQAPPIPIVSKRAFGADLREAFVSAHLTQRYHDLKQALLAKGSQTKRVVVYGGSFNPPGLHHSQIAERLAKSFDLVIVVPCGDRPDKVSVNAVSPEHRATMVQLAFAGMPKVQVDLFDLDGGTYTPAFALQQRYAQQFPEDQIWHAVGEDILTGGADQNSEIHRVWKNGLEIWHSFNFAIIARPGYGTEKSDFPPSHQEIDLPGLVGSSTMIREHLATRSPIDQLVSPEVEQLIREQGLYLPN